MQSWPCTILTEHNEIALPYFIRNTGWWIQFRHTIIGQQLSPSDWSVTRPLTHWGRVTHICVGNLTIIGSENGLSPGRRQAIIQTNAGRLLIVPLGTNVSDIFIGIQTFKKMHLKMSIAKWRPFRLGLNELTCMSSRDDNCSSILFWTDNNCMHTRSLPIYETLLFGRRISLPIS